MDNESREANQARLRQIARMCRAHGTGSDWPTLLGAAVRSLRVRPACPPLPNLRDPAAFLSFFGQTLEYVALPRKSKHHLASGSDISTKSRSWAWICERITADAMRPEWIHRPLFDQLGILFARPFVKLLAADYLHVSARSGLPVVRQLDLHP